LKSWLDHKDHAKVATPASIQAEETAELQKQINVMQDKLDQMKDENKETRRHTKHVHRKAAQKLFEKEMKDKEDEEADMKKPVYFLTSNGEYCPDGGDIISSQECRQAAEKLGKKWAEKQNPFYGVRDHRYCLFSDDGWQYAYFNTAQEDAADEPPRGNYASICNQVCSTKLFVKGGEDLEPDCMGTFHRTMITPSENHSSRAIYENSKGKHLYFWKPAGNWIIETDGHFDNSFGALYSHADVRCPEDALDWKIWKDNGWSKEYEIAVDRVEDKSALNSESGKKFKGIFDTGPLAASKMFSMGSEEFTQTFSTNDDASSGSMSDGLGAGGAGSSGLNTGALPTSFGGHRGSMNENTDASQGDEAENAAENAAEDYRTLQTDAAENAAEDQASAAMDYYTDPDAYNYYNSYR
jgi:hypothetical protein